ncbi:Uncharacterised protein [Mycobacteroides abscessus subsp. abscessus]|nr:Uncharacterised protein [Mycobacteroides abscessus subsp. abscessus]
MQPPMCGPGSCSAFLFPVHMHMRLYRLTGMNILHFTNMHAGIKTVYSW